MAADILTSRVCVWLAFSSNGDHFLGCIAHRFMGFAAADKPTISAQINAGVPIGECDYRGSGVCNHTVVENASPKFDWWHQSRSVTAHTTMAAPNFPALVRVQRFGRSRPAADASREANGAVVACWLR